MSVCASACLLGAKRTFRALYNHRLSRFGVGSTESHLALPAGAPSCLGQYKPQFTIMLGVRRSTVSIAAGSLQRAGVTRYQHGKITILDRVGLENAACECYDAVAGEYRALFGEYPHNDVSPPIP